MVLCRVTPLPVLLLSLLGLQRGCSGLEFRTRTDPDEPGWSVSTAVRVTGWRGRPAVLLCTFTHPGLAHWVHILVEWDVTRAGDYNKEVFGCESPGADSEASGPDSCATGNAKYRLAGDPQRKDASLEIRNPTLEDSGNYTCWVGQPEHPGLAWRGGHDTELLVMEPPNEEDPEDEQKVVTTADPEADPEEKPEEKPEERASFSPYNALQVAQIGVLLISFTVVSILCRSRSPKTEAFGHEGSRRGHTDPDSIGLHI